MEYFAPRKIESTAWNYETGKDEKVSGVVSTRTVNFFWEDKFVQQNAEEMKASASSESNGSKAYEVQTRLRDFNQAVTNINEQKVVHLKYHVNNFNKKLHSQKKPEVTDQYGHIEIDYIETLARNPELLDQPYLTFRLHIDRSHSMIVAN